jgi:zinc transporter
VLGGVAEVEDRVGDRRRDIDQIGIAWRRRRGGSSHAEERDPDPAAHAQSVVQLDAMASGLLEAFLFDGTGGATALDWDGVSRWTPADGVLWLNLDYAADDVGAWLATASAIEPLQLAALVDPDPRPRAVAHGDHLFMIVRGINLNEGAAPEDMISVRCYIEPRRIVTLRHRVSRSLQLIAADLRAGRGPTTTGEFTARFVEGTVDLAVTRVDTLGDEVAASEVRAIDDNPNELRAVLADHRRRAIALRRFLAPQREALGKLAAISLPWFDAALRARADEAAVKLMRTVEELDAARDRAAVTQEELGSRIGEQTNRRLYWLSVITAVFLPLGFICSLLGVNVGGVPLQHADWAFWALVGAFGIGVGIELWLFRRRGWL